MKRLKIFLITVMVMLASLVTYLSVSKVYADPTGTVTVNVTSYNKYLEYMDYWQSFDKDNESYENLNNIKKKNYMTSADYTPAHLDTEDNIDLDEGVYIITIGSYYAHPMGDTTVTLTKWDDVVAYKNSHPCETVTQFAPGDKIVFDFSLEVPTGFRSVRLGFDFGANGMGDPANPNALSDATNHAVDYDISSDDTYYALTYNSKIMKATTSNGQTGNKYAYVGGYLEAASTSITEKVSIGTIATTISTTASGTYNLTLDDNDATKSYFGDASNKYYASNITVTGVTSITVKSATSNKTTLSGVKVGGTTLTSSGDTIVDGNTCPTYPASDVSTSTTSTSININTEDNAKIQNVYYTVVNEGTTPTAIPSTTASGITGGSSGTFTITPTTWNPGQVLYAFVEVKSSDGSTTGYNIITIPKAKCTTKELTGLTITTNGTIANPTLSPTFATGTTSYTIKIAKDTTQVTLTPTFNTSVYQKCTIDGAEVASGSTKSVTVSTSTSYIDIIMTAQDGNTQAYRVNLSFLSSDKSLASSNPIQVTYSGATSGTVTATSSDGTNYTATAAVGSTGFTIKANLKNSSIQGLKYSTDGGSTFNTIGSGVSSSSISFDSGLAASTKSVIFRVTAEDGTTKDYSVNITRTAADTHNDISAITLYDSKGTTISGSFDSGNVFNVATDLDYSITGVKFKVTFPSTATAVATCGTQTCNLTSGSNSSEFTFSGTARSTLSITITVTAQDNTTQTYTINVSRRAADDNKTVTVVVKDSSGNLLSTTESSGVYTVDTTLPYTARKIYIEITCGTYTKIKYDGSVISGQKDYELGETPYFAWTFPFEFKICTELNPTGYDLKINVDREAADQNVDLDSYSVFGKNDNIEYSKESTSTTTQFNYKIPKSSAGSYFKLNLAAVKSTTSIYVSTTVPSGTSYGTLYNPSSNEFTIDTILYVTLVAQGKASQTYIFNVTSVDERNTNPQIDNIVISGLPTGTVFTFEKSTDATKDLGTITVPYSVRSLTITPTLEEGHKDTGGTSSWAKNDAILATTLSAGNNVLHFQGKAENGALGCDYTITIYRENGKTGNLLTNLKINSTHVLIDPADTSAPYTSANNIMYYRFNRGVYTQATLDFAVSDGAEFIIDVDGTNSANTSPYTCNLVAGGKVVVNIRVRSEKNSVDGTATYNTYQIELYVADDKYDVDNIEMYLNDGTGTLLTNATGDSFDFNNGSYTDFTVPYKRTNAIPKVYLASNSSNALITGEVGKNLTTPGSTASKTTFTITVKSEYAKLNSAITNQEVTYVINILREPAETDNKLKTLELLVNGTVVAFDNGPFNKDSSTTLYYKELITGGSTVSLNYEVNNPKATIASTSDVGPFTLASSNSTREFTIKVLNEKDEAREYKVKVSTDKLELEKNNSITSIQAFADNDLTNDLISFTQGQKQYNVDVRATVNKIHLFFTLPVSTSTVEVNGNTVNGTTLKYEYELTTKPGNNEIIIKCYAEDPSVAANEYKIVVNSLAADEDNSLKVFTINGTTVADGATIYFTNDIDKIDIVAERNSQYSTLSPVNPTDPSRYTITGKEINVGNNTITISVTNEKGETKQHIVTVVRDDVLTLDSLTVVDPEDFSATNLVDLANPTSQTANETVFEINVDYDLEKLDVSCIANALPANVTITGVQVYTLTAGAETVCTITVTAKSGALHKYIIKVNRAAGDINNFITAYKPTEDGEEKNVGTTTNEITYVVPKNTLVFTPYITVSEKAKVDPSTGLQYVITETNRNLSDGKNTFHITVTSQTGVDNRYTFYVYRSDTDYTGTISLLESAGGANIKDDHGNELVWDENNECTLTFAYSTKMAYLDIVTTSSDAVIYVDGKLFTSQTISISGSHTYIIYFKSEYGVDNPSAFDTESERYKLTINQEPANTDATLKTIKVTINGTVYEATQAELDSKEFIIPNIGNSVSSIRIDAEANVKAPKTSISGTGVQVLKDLNVDAGDGSVTGYIFSYPIIVTPEEGDAITYMVTVSRGPIDLDKDNTINFITIIDSNGNVYLDKNTFIQTKTYYEIVIPYGPQSYTIKADKLEVSPAVITGDGQTLITFTDGDMVKEHKVYATSQNKEKGTEYTIKITCKAPSSDSTLKDLKVDGITVDGFDPKTKNYVLSTVYPNQFSKLTIIAQATDPLSKVSGDIGRLDIEEGTNSFTITVTAQDGSISNYKLIVFRDYPLPYLTDLDIIGETLLNDKDKKTEFEKDVYEYHAIVNYMKLSATINASIDNATHIVSCGNASVITNTGRTRTFTVNLKEGINRFTITVTSSQGKKQTYSVVIQRRGQESTNTNVQIADIMEIEEFRNDYSNLQNVYEYTVPNKIKDLNVRLECENIATATNPGATYKIYNDKNLKVGLNQVIIVVTAEDGESTRVVMVNVTRLPMEFTVNTKATKYECSQSDDDEMTYVINLGKNNAAAITDYTKYIEFANDDNLSIEVLTDTQNEDCREVLVRVSDGSEEQIVRFKLLTENTQVTNNKSGFDFIVWLLLIITIIILATILICVNKDKYGSISKKRKKA